MAKKKASSPKKPSKKVGSRTRSTTSSTTANTSKKKQPPRPSEKSETRKVETADPPPTASYLRTDNVNNLLTKDQQFAYITLLSKGGSPAAACSQIGIALADVIWTSEHDSQFGLMLERIQELLSQNVAAALYRSAMEGSVTAQQYYLKNRPPPNWASFAAESSSTSETQMTDDEFLEYFRTEATALLDRISQSQNSST
ncbi:hypothetical protein [Thalassoglobus neptunius]|uniref:hypothetical protein n=1 Tax=Thalassoglobus neptunius TaxID=1938619 RepID=UPI0011B4BACB|nr:hypothetical protein [Thalassoglobus neptunius]